MESNKKNSFGFQTLNKKPQTQRQLFYHKNCLEEHLFKTTSDKQVYQTKTFKIAKAGLPLFEEGQCDSQTLKVENLMRAGHFPVGKLIVIH